MFSNWRIDAAQNYNADKSGKGPVLYVEFFPVDSENQSRGSVDDVGPEQPILFRPYRTSPSEMLPWVFLGQGHTLRHLWSRSPPNHVLATCTQVPSFPSLTRWQDKNNDIVPKRQSWCFSFENLPPCVLTALLARLCNAFSL